MGRSVNKNCLSCPLGPNVLLLTGPQQRAAPGSRRSSGVPEKHRHGNEDPVHSHAAWWKVSAVLEPGLAARPGCGGHRELGLRGLGSDPDLAS